nr:hypothetical protein [Saprospiraceae bacterium]
MFSLKKISFLLLAFPLVFVACDNDDDHHHDDDNEITINFISPQHDQVITMEEAENLLIQLEVLATDENHDIYIELHPENDASNKILDHHFHLHDPDFEFSESVDLSGFPSGTEFHLEVRAALDHDGDHHERGDIEFSIE